MNVSLQGKRALVCGASRGIGRATAQALADLGASVAVLARNRDALNETLATLAADAGQAHMAVPADTTDVDSLTRAVELLKPASSAIEILVNNSGGPRPGPAHEASPEEYLSAFRQHVVANNTLVAALLPGMKRAGYGRVINIISTSVKQPIKGLGVSNTIRGAVASWAKTLAGELGPLGITVNNVLPGYTATARLANLFEKGAERTGRPVKEIEQEAVHQIPLGRFAEPEEIAAAVAFLASPAAGYINGINLPVDGGRTSSL